MHSQRRNAKQPESRLSEELRKLAESLAIPAGIFLAAVFVAPTLSSLPRAQLTLLPYLPYVVFGLGLGLSWRFNSSRAFFALGTLLVAYGGLQQGLPHGLGHSVEQRVIFNYVGLLLPLTYTVVCLLRERGIFTVHGLMRFAAVMVPAAPVATLIDWWNVDLAPFLPTALLGKSHFGWTPILPIALGMFGVALSVLSIKLIWQRTSLNGAMMGALAAAAVALHNGTHMMSVAVLISASALIVTVGVIQDGYRKAYVDELTGLPGRRALEEELLKVSGSYVVAMLDVDRFKKFNDMYGHDVGDQVLRMVASHLRRVAGGGRPFRYGGEEFTILFCGKEAPQAIEHLDDLRQRIADSPFAVRRRRRNKTTIRKSTRSGGGRRALVTVSIGVAERNARLATPDKLIKAADQALYRAKRGGRNRVCS